MELKKKLLVCGATGFIGRNVTEYFAAHGEYDVYATHNVCSPFECEGVTWLKANLTDPNDVEKVVEGKDIVIQAAATTSGVKDIVERPYVHVTDNVVMNSYILRSAFHHHVGHLIFFSCSVMYSSSEKPVKENEFDANTPLYPSYFGAGWTKVYLEKMYQFYATLGRSKHTILRNSNIYGPYDNFDLERSHVFGATVAKVMSARDGRITVWGDGQAKRDLLYIDDLVQLVANAIRRQETPFALVNAGYGKSISILKLVQSIVDASRKSLQIVTAPDKPTVDTRLCLDITRANELFNWRPEIPLEEGIDRTLNWYSETLETHG